VTTGKHGVRPGVGSGHVDDRGYGYGTCTTTAAVRARAVRAVASMSDSAEECAELLAALGLDAQEGVSGGSELAS
jgi:hypothetical protein